MTKTILLLVAFICGACAQSIVAPARAYAPLHNNIPATFAGAPNGPIVYLCATELRNGEEDHYLQYDVCPTVLIK